jgi:outer membrane protein assembly factor BamB
LRAIFLRFHGNDPVKNGRTYPPHCKRKITTMIARSLCCLLATLLLNSFLQAENWPQWRGANGDGISTAKGIPAEFGPDKNIIWKLPMPGPGSSTPAIWDKTMFLTSLDNGEVVLMAISTDGKELWKRPLGKATINARNGEGNDASASPATDGKHVYVFAGTGFLGAFDFSGKEVWSFNVQERYKKFNIQFGMHSTPVLEGDRLYVQALHTDQQLVFAVDKLTGKEVWKIERQSDGRAECPHSYTSPVLWKKGDNAYLIVHGNDYATGHELATGKEIWRLGELNPKGAKYNPTLRFVASPLATPNLIIVPTAKSGPVVAMKPDAMGMITAGSSSELWRMKANTPDVPSPLLVGDLVFLCRETGNLICLDAKTGQEYYNQRTFNGRYRASPVYVDGKIILICRDNGVVTVVEASKEFKLLATNRMQDDMTASPAFFDNKLVLRGHKYLYCIGQK